MRVNVRKNVVKREMETPAGQKRTAKCGRKKKKKATAPLQIEKGSAIQAEEPSTGEELATRGLGTREHDCRRAGTENKKKKGRANGGEPTGID
jgi:hypothetical protein